MARQRVSPRVVVETEHYGSNNSIVVGDDGLVHVDSPHLLSDAKAWAAGRRGLWSGGGTGWVGA